MFRARDAIGNLTALFLKMYGLHSASIIQRSSLLEGDDYGYFFFMTNTELPSKEVDISYEKRGNVTIIHRRSQPGILYQSPAQRSFAIFKKY